MIRTALSLLDPASLAGMDDLSLLAKLVVHGFRQGMHKSLRQGRGSEFFQYRSYDPGEDIKNLDWKVYAKRDELVAKTYQEDTNINLVIVLDGSASMGYQGDDSACSKFRYAQMLAACLAFIGQRQGDRVGLFGGSEDSLEWIRPQSGRSALNRTLVQIGSMQPAGRDVGKSAWERFSSVLPPESIVIVLSDFLDGEIEWSERLRFARSPRNECLCLQVLDGEELNLPNAEALRFVDMERSGEISASPQIMREKYVRSMDEFLENLKTTVLRTGSEFESITTSQDLGYGIRSFLGLRTGRK